MPQGDTSRTELVIRREESWGVLDATTALPNFNEDKLRFRSSTLGPEKTTERSDEIRSDRQGGKVTQLAQHAAGDVSIRLSLLTYDEWLMGVMMANIASGEDSESWLTPISVEDIDSVNGSGVYTKAATDFGALGMKVGQKVRMTGFTNANNNGIKTVSAVGTTTFTTVGASTIEAAPPAASKVYGRMLRNGTTLHSWTIEQSYLDVGRYLLFNGMRCTDLSINLAAESFIEGRFGFMGKNSTSSGSRTLGTPSASITEVLNTTSNVAQLYEAGSALSIYTSQLDFNLTNNGRLRPAIQNLNPIGIGHGDFVANGSLNAYFEDASLLDKMLAHEATALRIDLKDDATTPANGNEMVIDLVRVFYSLGKAPIDGPNQDVFAQLEWEAEFGPVATPGICQIDLFVP